MYKINSGQQIKLEYLLYSLIIGIIVFWASWLNRTQLFQPTDMAEIGRMYSQSQYILGDAAVEMIDDSLTYAFAGYTYIQGEDPTIINFAHPPLVKYVFGLSYILSGSSYVLNLLVLVATLCVFLVLAKRLGLSSVFSTIAMIVFAVSTPLISHVGQTLLDTWLSLFAMIFLTLLLSPKLSSKKIAVGIAITIGVLASSKYLFPFILLYIGVLSFWLFYKKLLRQLLIILPVAGLIYLSVYTAFFINNHSLIDFFKFEVFRFNWWSDDTPLGKPYILHTFLNGCVQNWWSETNPTLCTPDADWRWWLPILAIAQFPAQIYQIMKRNMEVVIVGIFASAMLIMLLMASFSQMRYFYPVIPLWILLITLTFQQLINKYVSRGTSAN